MWKFNLLQNKYFLFISHISVKEISEDSSNYLLARLTFTNPLGLEQLLKKMCTSWKYFSTKVKATLWSFPFSRYCGERGKIEIHPELLLAFGSKLEAHQKFYVWWIFMSAALHLPRPFDDLFPQQYLQDMFWSWMIMKHDSSLFTV